MNLRALCGGIEDRSDVLRTRKTARGGLRVLLRDGEVKLVADEPNLPKRTPQ